MKKSFTVIICNIVDLHTEHVVPILHKCNKMFSYNHN